MEKYIIFLAYLAIPIDIAYLHNKKLKKSILVGIVITLLTLPITISISTENRPTSIATLIDKILYPIIGKQ